MPATQATSAVGLAILISLIVISRANPIDNDVESEPRMRITVKVGHHDENAKHNPIAPIRHGGFSNTSRHEWSKLPLNTGEQEAQSVELSSNRSKEHIVGHGGHEIALWGWRWKEVSTYLVTSAFLIIAAVVKILYHHSSLHHHVPESCVLIIFGTLFEVVIYLTGVQEHVPKFSSELFFFLLLPPIILESAYSLHDRVFFNNLGTVLLYAIVGTLINVFLIAPTLYFFGYVGAYGSMSNIPFVECLTFATLISAVDPVAVLAIFQELGVNKSLYFLVFGESLLNDAVVITMYNSVTIFAASASISAGDISLGILNFVTVSGGGLIIGLILGGLTAIITRFTDSVRVVEPMIVIVMAYLSYVVAELFHFSGIIGLIGCGLMQIEYAKHNISDRSYVTIKYFTRNLSSISDVIIFFFLGKVLVRETHVWNTAFVLLSTLACVVFRFASVFSLTYVANNSYKRIRFINFEEQLVMAYGGLRGAIAFSLAIMLNRDEIKNADLFITSTLFVILFTVFVLGSTTKTVVRLLRVKTEEKMDPKMFIFLNNKLMETLMAGLEDVAGQKSSHHRFQKLNKFNDRYLKKILIKGGASIANGYTEVYEKVKNRRPRSMMTPSNIMRENLNTRNELTGGKGVRFNVNGISVGPEVVQVGVEANGRRPIAKARKGSVEEIIQPVTPATPLRRPSMRKQSVISLLRGNSEDEEAERARRTLSSALSRTTFFQLPGSNYVHDESEERNRRQSMARYRRSNLAESGGHPSLDIRDPPSNGLRRASANPNANSTNRHSYPAGRQ